MVNISDFMRQDHKRLDVILKDFDSVFRFAEFKIGLQRHIVREEEILFPLFEEKTGINPVRNSCGVLDPAGIIFKAATHAVSPVREISLTGQAAGIISNGIKNEGPTEVMRAEHREIKGFLERIHDNISDKEAKKGLIEVLTAHNEKEETILYPWIEKSLTKEESETAFQKMESLPPEKYNKSR
jgi:iron-sulfur cluster repair protein YtfE (RIC family)